MAPGHPAEVTGDPLAGFGDSRPFPRPRGGVIFSLVALATAGLAVLQTIVPWGPVASGPPGRRHPGDARTPAGVSAPRRWLGRQVRVLGLNLEAEADRSMVRLQVVAGPATIDDEGLADARAANPFRLPRLHPGIGSVSVTEPVVGAECLFQHVHYLVKHLTE
jgi:hypothetical protein